MDRTSEGEELEHRMLDVDEIEMHAVVAGPADGPPVMLLHGFPEFWYGWHRQLGPLAQAGYRVIAPDLRGYNLSGKPRGIDAYQAEHLQRDVLGLLDALGIDKARVVGHDWGGVLAWMLAADHPERIERLCILNAPHPQVFKRTLMRSPLQALRSGYMAFFQLPWMPEFMLRQQNYWFLEQTFVRTSQRGTFTQAELDHYKQAWSQPGALTAMLSWYRALPRYAARPIAQGRISMPTLILWGRQDFALGPYLAEDSLAECDDGRLEWIQQAGHWVQHEAHREVNQRLLEFLRQDAAAAATGERRTAP